MDLAILQVVPELNSGGVERGTIDVSRFLHTKGVNNIVVSNGGSMLSELKEIGTEHIKLPMHTKNPFKILYNAIRLKAIIERRKINIVHARSRAPAWSAYIACWLTGARFVTTFEGAYNAMHPLKRWYNSVMLKGLYTIAVSQYIKKHIETRYHHLENVEVINRGVDTKFFDPKAITEERKEAMRQNLGIRKDVRVILMPARFTEGKGHIYLLNALKLYKGDYIALFVGHCKESKKEYRDNLLHLIKEYKLEHKVFLHDAVADMPALYSLANVVIVPSQQPESFGRIVIESYAMQVPVIATNIGAPADIIKDGITGWLCKSNDSYSLVEKLQIVMELDEKAKDKVLKNATKELLAHYTVDKMCSYTLDLYHKILLDYEDEFGHLQG